MDINDMDSIISKLEAQQKAFEVLESEKKKQNIELVKQAQELAIKNSNLKAELERQSEAYSNLRRKFVSHETKQKKQKIFFYFY